MNIIARTVLVFIGFTVAAEVCAEGGAKSLFDNVIPAIVKERKKANEVVSAPREKQNNPETTNADNEKNAPNLPRTKPTDNAQRSDTNSKKEKYAAPPVQKKYVSSKPKTTQLVSNSAESNITKKASKKASSRVNKEDAFVVDEGVQESQYAGIKYWIDMESDKGLDRVATNHLFRAGDRIKIKIVPNINGYLNVYNIGTTGRKTRLFPASENSAKVIAGVTYTVPAAGMMRFDENPGREEIGIFLTDRPISMDGGDDSGAQSGQRASYASAMPVSCKGSKDLILESNCAKKPTGSKDLILEKSTDTHGVAEYAVAPMRDISAGQSVSLNFFLNHK